MAQSGVKQFVLRQNGVAPYDSADDTRQPRKKPGAMDYLKADVPRLSSSHSRSRAKVLEARGGGRGPAARTRSQSENQPPPSGNMFGTDASNADRTSASGSTQHAEQGNLPRIAAVGVSQAEAEDSDASYETDDSLDNAEPDEGSVKLDPAQAQPTNKHNAFVDHQLDGDSYPATTSGRQSEADVNDAHFTQPLAPTHVQGMQAQTHVQGMQAPHSVMQVRGAGIVRGGGMAAPVVSQQQLASQPQAVVSISGEDIATGFTFTKASAAKPNIARPAPQLQRASKPQPALQQNGKHHYPAHAPLIAQQVQQSSQHGPKLVAPEEPAYLHAPVNQAHTHAYNARDAHREPRQPLGNFDHQYGTTNARGFMHSTKYDVNKHKSRTTAPGQPPPQPDMRQESEQYLDFVHHNGIHGPALENVDEQHTGMHHSEQQPEPDMDYMPPELYEKSYSDIKAQSFDLDPQGQSFNLPQDKPTDTLHDKLSVVMSLQRQDQADFFRVLNVQQWEDAGDWFLERFGHLVGKLKDARKEKRKAARAFEDEIEQRHEAIAMKQTLTMTALGEMKESGGKVLQGTPKKLKKPKK